MRDVRFIVLGHVKRLEQQTHDGRPRKPAAAWPTPATRRKEPRWPPSCRCAVAAAEVYAVGADERETLCATLLGTARNIDPDR